MSWILNDLFALHITTPVGLMAYAFVLLYFDYVYLVPRYFVRLLLDGPPRPSSAELPSGIIIVPTLLRARDEVDAIKTTLGGVVRNRYPGKLIVVASIDGYGEAPALYDELCQWVAAQQATLDQDVWLYVTGTPARHGKPLAIEHALQHVKGLVARGVHAEFPKIYFSTDADADLGEHALEFIARRLCRRNPITGAPKRAVAGNLYVRGNAYWQGLRHFFTVEGQLGIQVAREYLVTNIARYNLRPFPLSGITGVLYCMWTDILLEGPRYMGFMRTLRLRDWLKWWIGFAPPKFSESAAAPIPSLLAGDTDDTVSAFLAIIARWEDGRFTLDAPRTPLHAFYYMLRAFLVDRALSYEPNARVYTSSPATIKALWKQRVRWNAARVEVAGRFSRSFLFHWELGIAAIGVVMLMLKYIFFGGFYYLMLPSAMVNGAQFLLRVVLASAVQIAFYGLCTVLALLLNGELRKNWRILLALPATPVYVPIYGFWASFAGIVKDILLFGNCTKFAPETTLIAGGSTRIALLARARRAFVLLVRSALYGDVPLGWFWFGWGETPWTPSGYQGWTSNRRPSFVDQLRFGAAQAAQASESVRLNEIAAGSQPIPTMLLDVASPSSAPSALASAAEQGVGVEVKARTARAERAVDLGEAGGRRAASEVQ